jgi:1-aminocyclopropane-1-carboxylate deaminase/D-cysteine desulfhydrase-like pyridoxal-dependent ACC family enzyme
VLQADIEAIVGGIFELLKVRLTPDPKYYINVDDRFVGEGYGVPTAASREAIELAARTEAIFLDPTYTAKAMAGLIAYLRDHTFDEDQTVLFWHTGGQVGLFV